MAPTTTSGPARSRSIARTALGALLLAALTAAGSPPAARADELADLRAENSRLRDENARLRADLEALRAAPPVSASPASPGSATVERVFVPRSRVTLETKADGDGGAETVSTPWYRTAEGGPLPRKEWLQFRARRDDRGALAGAWMLLDRRTGRGSLESVREGSLTVDGRTIACAVEDYEVASRQPTVRDAGSSMREERVRFALPADALTLLGGATRARFSAGSSEFELSDEQLTAAAALAARVQPSAASQPGSNRAP